MTDLKLIYENTKQIGDALVMISELMDMIETLVKRINKIEKALLLTTPMGDIDN